MTYSIRYWIGVKRTTFEELGLGLSFPDQLIFLGRRVSGGGSRGDSQEVVGDLRLCGIVVQGEGRGLGRISNRVADLGKSSVSYDLIF